MLELRNIKKDYLLKDQEPVHALKGISLNFRANEFVAILGHSGCGKTTLLNITGGLDHYDDGDLIIKGISTKNFKDGDWDTYRNHSVGFVFQSYNLIPHQTIIKNVELALTISGVSKEERYQRAKEALDIVGLSGLYRKKPNQLSGGQMQRVAIARALVNSPEIVLADEPTGALDSETSVQIMDILKEISKNHLVIMVTHNPEIAEAYASRIVRMKDGLITSDSNPFDGKEKAVEKKEEAKEVNKGKKKQSSMSFFTATGLSVSNLISKLKRTLLVAIAGSIGIIGVSTILGVSCGVNNYIDDMQDDMLSSYPIGITEESMDMTSLLTGLSNQDKKELAEFDTTTHIGMDSMITFLMSKYTDFTHVKTNDINEELVNYINDMPEDYYSAITMDYGIDPTNNIYTRFKKEKKSDETEVVSINGLTQSYIETLNTVDGFSSYASFVDLFKNFMRELPDEEEYIMSQYDMLGDGHFATGDDEIMLVVDEKTTLTDLILAQMGYYPQDEFLRIAEKAIKTQEIEKEYKEDGDKAKRDEALADLDDDEAYQYDSKFTYDYIYNHDFYYYPHNAIYKKDPTFVSHKQAVASFSGMTATGYRYILSLTYVAGSDAITGTYIVLDNTNSIIVNEYCALIRMGQRNPSKSVFDGSWMGATTTSFRYITLNLNTDGNPDVEGRVANYHVDSATSTIRDMSLFQVANVESNAKITETEPETPDFYYNAFINDDPDLADKDISEVPGAKKMKIAGILRKKSTTNFGTLNRGVYYTNAFANKYMADAAESEIVQEYQKHITDKKFLASSFNAYVYYKYDSYDSGDEPTQKYKYASALNGELTSSMASLFFSFLGQSSNSVDGEKEHLRCISGLKIIEIVDEDTGKVIDYDTDLLPQAISIYPQNFEQKDKVTAYLDEWNKNEDHTELTYSDTISMIVAVISTLVTTISIALIAFTSLSLVVSCFMIAVITYISVMERVKEIGVIRSLGGRKKDVSRLFIAENLITGLSSGIFGILITYLLQIIINLIVAPFGVSHIAALPWYYALLMIGIAVVLSVVSGLIPSMSASKQDPVIALRTE